MEIKSDCGIETRKIIGKKGLEKLTGSMFYVHLQFSTFCIDGHLPFVQSTTHRDSSRIQDVLITHSTIERDVSATKMNNKNKKPINNNTQKKRKFNFPCFKFHLILQS